MKRGAFARSLSAATLLMLGVGIVPAAAGDVTPPHAGIRPLPALARADVFSVAWTGADAGGSGVASYDVQVSADGGAYTDWVRATTSTAAMFSGVAGHAYAFRVRARDVAGNVGPYDVANTWVAAPSLAPGQFLRVDVDWLRVRSAPGIGSPVLGYARVGSLGAIVAAPTSVDGYPWYEIREPLATWAPVAATTTGWVAAGAGWLSPIQAPNTTRAPILPTVRAAWPASATAVSGPAASNLISWSSTGAAATDVTEEVSTAPSPNVDCRGVSWRVAWTLSGRTSPFRIVDFATRYCYRYTITVRSATGQAASARTGTLWIYPPWTGGMNLYRSGVFATQQTMTWCVPASAEMILNIVDDRSIQSATEQSAFYTYGRTMDYADYPEPGLDPQGAAAILVHEGQRYSSDAFPTLDAAERDAVRRMRVTGKPVIVYMDKAVHAWVLNGFTATADPAATSAYTVTSYSVMGPLWPIQQYYKGYFDMPPNTSLPPVSFAAAVGGPFDDAIATPWEGLWVVTVPR